MACPFCRSLAWIQHKLDVRAQNKATQAEKQAEIKAAQDRDAARTERIERDRSASFSGRRFEPPPTPLPPP